MKNKIEEKFGTRVKIYMKRSFSIETSFDRY